MQTKDINELKQQAILLGRHLRSTHGTELSHSALLEALAAMHNAPDWNALQARKPAKTAKAAKPAEDLKAEKLLELAAEKGLTVGEAINFFAERQSPHEKAYAEYARENLASDGDLEFDDPGCIVSLSEDGGAYIMAWKWCGSSEVLSSKTPPERLTEIRDFTPCIMGVYKDGEKVDAAFDARIVFVDGHADECLTVIDRAGNNLFVLPLNADNAEMAKYKLTEDEDDYVDEYEPDEEDGIFISVKADGWELRLELGL